MNSYFRPFTAIAISVSLVFAPLSQASNPAEKSTAYTEQLKLIVENTQSVKQLSFFLAFLGASDETVKAVSEDISKLSGGKETLPKGEFRGKKFYVNDKETSFEIVSYEPLNVAFKGKLWAYDKSQPFEKNYFSFSKFISQNSKTGDSAFLRLLLPKANADDEPQKADPASAAITGMGSGLIASVIIAAFAIIAAPAWVPAAALGTAIIGTGVLISSYFFKRHEEAVDREQKAIINKLISGQPQVKCSPTEVEVNFKSLTDSTTLKIDRKKAAKVAIYDKDGTHISNEQITAAQQKVVFSLLDNCKSPEDAKKFADQWQKVRAYFVSRQQKASENKKARAKS